MTAARGIQSILGFRTSDNSEPNFQTRVLVSILNAGLTLHMNVIQSFSVGLQIKALHRTDSQSSTPCMEDSEMMETVPPRRA